MTATITVPTRLYEDHDDCLTAAAEDYIAAHPEAAGYDMSPRWDGGDDGEREAILLDVPCGVRCECGTATGVQCEWTGPREETVRIEWMPPYLRESHRAAGNSGSWPHNGSIRLRVHPDCAAMLSDDDT